MEDQLMMNVAAVMLSLHREDAQVVNRIQHRQAALSERVAAVIKEKTEHLLEVTNALADFEIRCDAVTTYVEDFLRDKSEVKRFEGRLQKTLKLLEEKQATGNAPSKINKTGPYTLYEIKVNYSKVQFKMESLQSLVEKAMDDKTTSTSAQPKKPKHNRSDPPSFIKVLSPTLDMIIEKLKHILKLASIIMLVTETRQNKLNDLVSKVKIADQKDFYLIGANHAHVHDLVDILQRSVYDKTMPQLTDSEIANLVIGRPVERPNPVVPLKSRAELDESVKNIERRLERINKFCNDSLNKQMNSVMSLVLTESMEDVEQYLDREIFPDIPAAAAARQPQAEEPQAEEPQAEEPQAEEPQVEEPQAEEPQAEEPQAEEPQAGEPQGSVLD